MSPRLFFLKLSYSRIEAFSLVSLERRHAIVVAEEDPQVSGLGEIFLHITSTFLSFYFYYY